VAKRSEPRSSWAYEHRLQPLLPWPLFLRRAVVNIILAAGTIIVVDGIGTVGYHAAAQLPWVDAFLNASMILGGMGPVDRLPTTSAKIFAALYALFSGLVFIAIMGVILAPWLHRVLHQLHAAEEEGDATSASGRASK
jgi:hypothetical protein